MLEKSYISINGHTIRKNAMSGTNDPPIRVARIKSDAHPRYAHEIRINGPCSLVYSKDRAILKCGARLVLECLSIDLEIMR